MDEEGGKGGKKKGGGKGIDIMTILGLVLAIVLVVFGIIFALPPSEPDPDAWAYVENPDQFDTDVEKYELSVDKYDHAGGILQFGNLGSFIDVPSIAITVGGAFAALMIAYPLNQFMKMGKWMSICIMPTKYNPADYIDQIVDFAKEARIKGLLSLEDKLANTQDEFLKSSLMMVVDSVEPEKVHELLEMELDKLTDRHGIGRAFMDSGAALAPGFGMIGTLIGLVNMLKDMSDPGSIGPAMAVALLTTLYGSLLANVLFSPMANKLSLRHDEEYLCKELIAIGVEAIQAGENPKFIEEKLNMLVVQQKKGKGKKAKSGGDE